MNEERCCAAPWCGKVLVRRPSERVADYEVRKHCDKSCAAGNANYKRRSRVKVLRKS